MLALVIPGSIEPGTVDYALSCRECGYELPVRGGVLRFVQDDDYTASFGWQWRRFHVARPEEDRVVFAAKTGCQPEQLAGLKVLDAGCGGGRYSRLVAAAGGYVVGVDRSRAVDAAAQLCRSLPNAFFVQADLLDLPFDDEEFDFVFSIGVLHHCPDPHAAFRELARVVRPGGRLAVWVYRKNTWLQERLNEMLRGYTLRMEDRSLQALCEWLAVLGGLPFVRVTLNKIANFSGHPDWELRVCDNYDWYACRYQFHHTDREVRQWYAEAGFEQVTELQPLKMGRLYRWAYRHNLIIGSGVNYIGVKSIPRNHTSRRPTTTRGCRS